MDYPLLILYLVRWCPSNIHANNQAKDVMQFILMTAHSRNIIKNPHGLVTCVTGSVAYLFLHKLASNKPTKKHAPYLVRVIAIGSVVSDTLIGTYTVKL